MRTPTFTLLLGLCTAFALPALRAEDNFKPVEIPALVSDLPRYWAVGFTMTDRIKSGLSDESISVAGKTYRRFTTEAAGDCYLDLGQIGSAALIQPGQEVVMTATVLQKERGWFSFGAEIEYFIAVMKVSAGTTPMAEGNISGGIAVLPDGSRDRETLKVFSEALDGLRADFLALAKERELDMSRLLDPSSTNRMDLESRVAQKVDEVAESMSLRPADVLNRLTLALLAGQLITNKPPELPPPPPTPAQIKAEAEARRKAEAEERRKAEEAEEARIAAEKDAQRKKLAEERAAKAAAEKAAEEEEERLEAEEREAAATKAREEARKVAEAEKARIAAEKAAARQKAADEAAASAKAEAEEEARLKSEAEAKRRKLAEEKAARLAAEKAAEEEQARIEAEQEASEARAREEARKRAAEEKARLAAEKDAARKSAASTPEAAEVKSNESKVLSAEPKNQPLDEEEDPTPKLKLRAKPPIAPPTPAIRASPPAVEADAPVGL